MVWKSHVLGNMNSGTNCVDTSTGVCYTGDTLDECIARCDNSPVCAAGLYSVLPDKSTICLDIDTSRQPELNPIKRIEPQTDSRLGDVSVFVDTRVYPFPPVHGRAIRYTDMISISSLDGFSIAPSTSGTVKLEKSDPANVVQILPPWGSIQEHNMLSPITYGSMIHISPPSTNLTALSVNYEWRWFPTPIMFDDFTGIQVLPTGDKQIGDVIMSGDTVRLVHSEQIVAITRGTHELVSVWRDDPNLETEFVIRSNMVGYECKSGICTPVNIGDTKNDAVVYRKSDCYGQCNNRKMAGAVAPAMKLSLVKILVGICLVLLLGFAVMFIYAYC